MKAGKKWPLKWPIFSFIQKAFIIKHVQYIQLTFSERLLLHASPCIRYSMEESRNLKLNYSFRCSEQPSSIVLIACRVFFLLSLRDYFHLYNISLIVYDIFYIIKFYLLRIPVYDLCLNVSWVLLKSPVKLLHFVEWLKVINTKWIQILHIFWKEIKIVSLNYVSLCDSFSKYYGFVERQNRIFLKGRFT